MKKSLTPSVCFKGCLVLMFSCFAVRAADGPGVRLIREEKVIRVEIGSQPFTTYHFADNFIIPYVRPFLWPVKAADGTEVTIDQAQFRKEGLHPHQRSIWIGHGNVNGANEWKVTTKPIQPKERHVKFDEVKGDTLKEELIWEDKTGEPMLGETRTIRFIAYPDGGRGIDFTLFFKPLHGDVTFSNANDTGLCPVRLIPSISHEPELMNSAGGKTQEECDLKRADWCDESGMINGKKYGVAILDFPANPRHPPLWHAHRDARLSSDIFSIDKSDGKKHRKSDGDFTIKAGSSATFRYRMVIHTGGAEGANLAEKYKEFCDGK